MVKYFKPFALLIILTTLLSFSQLQRHVNQLRDFKSPTPKIQVAILLDVSSSMDGLIEQAKAQLWNMVSVMGKAQCSTGTPQVEIALYEYGRTANDPNKGYIKQITPFTTDLNTLSLALFSLNTGGGDEYCGQVIHQSIKELAWDTAPTNYKVIFIAGNEDFLQGSVKFKQACGEAAQKGVIVNTIYCGPKEQGIREHWNLGGECGGGSFTYIDQNAVLEDIPTPYDSALMVLNGSLNNTYIAYGYAGRQKVAAQATADANNYSMNKSVALQRVAVKGKKELYKNESWDLVDAAAADSTIIAGISLSTLPDSLQKKTRAELQKVILQKNTERSLVQKEIGELSVKREAWLAAERRKSANANQAATLESEVEKIIRQQAKRYGMTIQ
ncbi:MAG: von Willebrand factor type [Flaviaesturariibacter sp.]|nr:von Willebrand factor type [Flaviaesturariibacter sp.]